MSRVIKFRAWNKEARQYELPMYRGVANLNINDILAGSTLVYEQFTGLKDKNGKEIYEGDVLAFEEGGKKVAEVRWSEKRAQFLPSAKRKHSSKSRVFEVVGNIFEHPELLTSKP